MQKLGDNQSFLWAASLRHLISFPSTRVPCLKYRIYRSFRWAVSSKASPFYCTKIFPKSRDIKAFVGPCFYRHLMSSFHEPVNHRSTAIISARSALQRYIVKSNLFYRTVKGEGDWVRLATSFAKPNPCHNNQLCIDDDVTIFQWHRVQLQRKRASEKSYRFGVQNKADELVARVDLVDVLQKDGSKIQMGWATFASIQSLVSPRFPKSYLQADTPFSMPDFSGPDTFPPRRTAHMLGLKSRS